VIKRALGLIVAGLLLFWGSFAFLSILAYSEDQSLVSYFSAADEQIIAVHHPKDFNLREIQLDANQRNVALFTEIQPKLRNLSTAYLSKTRNLMVITLNEKWNFQRVRSLFQHGNFSFEKTGTATFNFGNYRGVFQGKELLLYDYSMELSRGTLPEITMDQQASYSIIEPTTPAWNVDNYYIKPDEKILYQVRKSNKTSIPLVDDLALFESLLPEDLSYYEFFEKEYLRSIDPVFRTSPLEKIVQTGGLILTYEGFPVFIFDLAENQELVPYLNEVYHIPEENKERTTVQQMGVCEAFEKLGSPSKLVAFSRDGFGYISPEEKSIDGLLLALDIRKTNAAKPPFIKDLESLPRKCSHRKVTPSTRESLSWIDDRRVSTAIIRKTSDNRTPIETENIKNYFTMNPGSPVVSFCALTGRGNVIIETENELIGYKNGSLKWRQELPVALVFKPLRLATSLSENDHILLNDGKHLTVIDFMGRTLFSINQVTLCEAVVTQLKGQHVFGIAQGNELMMYSSENGKLVKRYQLPEKILSMHRLSLQGTFGIGIKTNLQTIILDLTTGKKVNVKGNVSDFVQFSENGALFRGKKGMELHTAKGITEVQVPAYWKFGGSITLEGQSGELFYEGSTLALAVQGKIRWKTTTELKEISQLCTNQNRIVLRDGLNNKLVILDTNGSLIDQEERPSQGEVQATPFGHNGCSITTYLSNFLIQFNF